MFGLTGAELAAVCTAFTSVVGYLGLQLKEAKDIRDGLLKRQEKLEADLGILAEENKTLTEEKHKQELRAKKAEWELGTKTRRVSYLLAEIDGLKAQTETAKQVVKLLDPVLDKAPKTVLIEKLKETKETRDE